MQSKQWLLFALLSGIGLTASRADIAPDPMSGGISLTEVGTTHTQVTLVHNTVKIWATPVSSRTRAFSRLRNTGQDVAFEAGFPLIYKGEAADFQIFIDGEKQAFTDREETKVVQMGPMRKPVTYRWKVWPMQFAAGQMRLVEVRYSNEAARGISHNLLSHSMYPSAWRLRQTGTDYDMKDFGFPQSLPFYQWIATKSVQYILVSGSYWKGPIERCRVEMNIENLSLDAITDVLPPARSFSSKQIVWEWNNVEPAQNIEVTFFGASPRKTILPFLQKIAAAHPEDKDIAETLTLMQRDFPPGAPDLVPSFSEQTTVRSNSTVLDKQRRAR